MVTCTILYTMNRTNIAHYIPGHLPCISPLTFDHRNRIDRYQPGHPGTYALNIDFLNRYCRSACKQIRHKSTTRRRDLPGALRSPTHLRSLVVFLAIIFYNGLALH